MNRPLTRGSFASRSQVLDFALRGPRTMAVLGDSISAQGFGGSSAGGWTFASVGYADWAVFLSRQRVNLLPTSNHGVSGETSAEVLARIADVVALAPGVCVVLAGTNDIGTLTPAQTVANLGTIYDTLRSAGIFVIAVPILPRGSLSTAEQGKIQQVNKWVRLQRLTRRNFAIADCELAYIDLATGIPKTTMSADGTHPIVYGAWALGNEIATIINAIYPDSSLPFINRLDVYSATDNPGGNLLAGSVGLTEGTTGTLSNGPTGSLATSWSANGVNLPSGVTAVFAKVTKADGRSFQQITFGGTYNLASPVSFNVTAPSVHASCAAGDTLELSCELEADSGIAFLSGAQLLIDVATPSGNPVPIDMVANNTHLLPPVAFSGVMKTPKVTLPGTPTLVRPTLRFTPQGVGGSSVLAGVVRFGCVSIRKV